MARRADDTTGFFDSLEARATESMETCQNLWENEWTTAGTTTAHRVAAIQLRF